jgi:uncharacterized protein (DUF1800 family)
MNVNMQKQRDAKHFASRLYFSETLDGIVELSREKPIVSLQKAFTIPSEIVEQPKLTPLSEVVKLLDLPKEKRNKPRQKRQKEKNLLSSWWLKQIHRTNNPLQERMALFWHNHFTTSARNVAWPQLMYRQNQLLRKHALGSFASLLRDIFKDPAMLIYLNGNKNVAKKPNENFARELLELFTLGEGHYTEQDVIEAAKAFTGWRYRVKQDDVILSLKRHDQGHKDFLGHSGRFDANDIVDILLDTPRTAEFIAEKFWHHFINPQQPDRDYISHWAMLFRDSNYQIKVLISAIVESDVFWAEANRGAFIKSPVELTVGLLNELGLDNFKAYRKLANINGKLGQRLFFPPDVKGWRGGKHWINNTTFVLRDQFIRKLSSEHIVEMMQMGHVLTNEKIERIQNHFLSLSPATPVDFSQSKQRQILSLLTDPAYQLK